MPVAMNILLVECNPINVAVIEETLDVLGYKADVVVNGEQALEKLSMEASHYNIVLMDCDIPHVDGYEITRQIRKGKGGMANQHIPVIAMCSSEIEGLRDKCSSAGMNDYTTMPIEPESLGQKLVEWATSNRVDDVDNSPALIVWDEEEVFARMRGKKDRLVRLIEMFLKNLPDNMSELESAIKSLDMNLAKEKAHVIKGVAANMSGQQLRETMTKCEAACIEGNVDLAQELLPFCLQHCEALSQRLRQYINS